MRLSRWTTVTRALALALVAASTLHTGAMAAPGKANEAEPVNPHSPRLGHLHRHGVAPSRDTHAAMRRWAASYASNAPVGTKTLSYGGGTSGIGVLSGPPKVYLVFYGSQWGSAGVDANGNTTLTNDTAGAAPYMQQLFKGLGTNNELWSGVVTQYCDGPLVAVGATTCPAAAPRIGYPTGGALAGVWVDNSAPSPVSASASTLVQEAIKAAAHFGNTTAASNRYVQYIIMSPPGATPDNWVHSGSNGWCAWHGWNGDPTLPGGGIASPYGPIAYTNMPYLPDAGTDCGGGTFTGDKLEGLSIVGGHEYAETVTDPLPGEGVNGGGWVHPSKDSSGNWVSHPAENADECGWIKSGQGAIAKLTLATGSFAMQSSWSNDTNRCDLTHPIVTATTGGGTTGPTELLGNNGLETGAASPWSMTAGVLCTTTSCSPQTAHTGTGFAWMNGYGSAHTDTVSQTVTIPAGKTSATFSFYLKISTSETGTTAKDTLTVQVLNSAGTVVGTLATYSNANASAYALKSFNLSTYIGQTITLKVTGLESSSVATSFFLDDLSLLVQ
jgi:serine protease